MKILQGYNSTLICSLCNDYILSHLINKLNAVKRGDTDPDGTFDGQADITHNIKNPDKVGLEEQDFGKVS